MPHRPTVTGESLLILRKDVLDLIPDTETVLLLLLRARSLLTRFASTCSEKGFSTTFPTEATFSLNSVSLSAVSHWPYLGMLSSSAWPAYSTQPEARSGITSLALSSVGLTHPHSHHQGLTDPFLPRPRSRIFCLDCCKGRENGGL